ncbi:hypothetical protein BKK54_10370 [Rodentibacter genomosp. 1]|uniref:Uncharacterized protein n=1 Tax=Rodentibacter genomosp. 1 TaxID=1908264 RepID=A0A1V3J1K2_9PAST|nr:hypothetical protein BKK54_10370 [Rodentibacter genomosp. 1]
MLKFLKSFLILPRHFHTATKIPQNRPHFSLFAYLLIKKQAIKLPIQKFICLKINIILNKNQI